MISESQKLSRGRPRSDKAHQAILRAAIKEVSRRGFRALTMDDIAARAGVGKMTVYRRWPNKGAVVMDAFLALIGPETQFPEHPQVIQRIKMQMRLQAKFFSGKYGQLIRTLLGESQFDMELAEAFRDRWLQPRRQMTREILELAVKNQELLRDINYEAAIDLLYGPFYYRLQLGTGAIDQEFADEIFRLAIRALK